MLIIYQTNHSLSRFSGVQTFYEIVKAHGGKLKVETKEGEGSEFSI